MSQEMERGPALALARNPYCKVRHVSRTLLTKEGHLF
jgi:hypothetical protein